MKKNAWIESELLPVGVRVPRGSLFVVELKVKGVWHECDPPLPSDATLDTLDDLLSRVGPFEQLQLVAVRNDARLAIFPDPRKREDSPDLARMGVAGVAQLISEHVPGTSALLAPMLAFLGQSPASPIDDLRKRWGLQRGFTRADLARAHRARRAQCHPDACAGDRTQWDACEREHAVLVEHAR